MRANEDLYTEIMTPSRKLEIIEDRLDDVKKMIEDVQDDLFHESLRS